MLFSLFSKLSGNKKIKCLLITPPLIDSEAVYSAMPILAGQLINNGYAAENLDLNIKFFRTVLSESYLLKTKKLLNSKKIKYDNERADYYIKNISAVIEQYRTQPKDTAEFKQAEKQIDEILKFISLPYKNFELSLSSAFDCFAGGCYRRHNLDNITGSKDENIFIDFFGRALNGIKKEKPDLIFITIPFIGALIPALTLSRMLKQKTKAFIALGGSFLKYEDLRIWPDFFGRYCDFVLIGDGEEAALNLAQAVKNPKILINTAGLMYKNESGIIIFNEPKPVLKMNTLANMSYEGINFDEYMRRNPSVDMMLSKGCSWGKCNFCALAQKEGGYRIKPPKIAARDIKELITKYGRIFTLRFQDDSLPPLYLDKLADEIIKADIHINYFIFARFEKEFTKELFEKLYKSGLRSIFWGLESGSITVLKKMNKGIELDNVFDILKNAYETGIDNLTGVIINFPGETIEEYNETLNFLMKIKKYTKFAPGNFNVMKNSIIEKNPEKFGIKITGYNEFCYNAEWIDLNISNEERERRWNYFLKIISDEGYELDRTIVKDINYA